MKKTKIPTMRRIGSHAKAICFQKLSSLSGPVWIAIPRS
jgi:hypothetical protein